MVYHPSKKQTPERVVGGLGVLIGQVETTTGHKFTKEQKVIAEDMTFRQWVPAVVREAGPGRVEGGRQAVHARGPPSDGVAL
jgi:hypothetical protein